MTLIRDMIEREVKWDVALSFTVPDLRDVVEGTRRQPEQRLWATYYDTSQLRLWHRGITLRHRSGESSDPSGTAVVWTLKLPEGAVGHTLDRRELTWHGSDDHIPDEAADLLRGIVRHAPLQEIARIETRRRRLILSGPDDRVWAELDDDVVTIHGGSHDGTRFRQIELEIERTAEGCVEPILDRLATAGARPGSRPKLAYALDQPLDKARLRLASHSSIGDVVRASIANGLDRLLDHEYLIRVESSDPAPHAIHQTRVAARRLRSDLKTFAGLLDPIWVRKVRGDLKTIGSALGDVRDVDVMVTEFRKHVGTVRAESIGSFVATLTDQRRAAARRVLDALNTDGYLSVLDRLAAAVERPPFLEGVPGSRHRGPGRGASKALPRIVRRPWKKLRKQVKRSGAFPTAGELHQIRICSKELRYAAEAAAPVIGGPARRMAKAAERVQTELGEHHDAVGAERWLRAEASDAPSPAAFAAGQLTHIEQIRQQGEEERWRSAWKALNRKKVRHWLA